MGLPKRYNPSDVEHRLQVIWQESGVYHFDPGTEGPVYSIDTPPATVSGHLHLGHVYSYSQTDFMARFWRMNGYDVFYPMGYDDNGLPTERLVERRLGVTASEVGRRAFIQKCLQVSEQEERNYESLWQRLGLSIDWRYTYRTIDELSRRTSQLSFLDLYRKGLVYHREAPSIWCPKCRTAIAQAELDDLERESTFVTLAFQVAHGETLPIATTRPELLPACVAVFVHPDDGRFRALVGQRVTVPLFGQDVPVLENPGADPEKGTGAVMCCTFGDTADVEWWYTHNLPLKVAIGRDGRLTEDAGNFVGLPVAEARRQITQALEECGLLLDRQSITQSVRIHERCDTPVEYIVTRQWFVRLLDFKGELLEAGEKVVWHPDHMKARYRAWVENLQWDWCISRQRYFGVPFPVWYCDACGEVAVADESQLPVDPIDQKPGRPCGCGSTSFTPERDVMDTWATSSLTPQIVGQWLTDEELYQQVFPMSLRPQAHEIIRTWAFYTIVKSHFHFSALPWKEAAISGWGLAPEGTGKISKSRGGGPVGPMEMIERYSADAVRYWAASTGLGKDSVISEEKIQAGARLVTKLWNVARFSQRFVAGYCPPTEFPILALSDRWILSRTQRLIQEVTKFFHNYDFAAAKSEIESFFWQVLADNYLEMCKLRLYEEGSEGARYTLHSVLLTILKLFAPFLPHVTEEIYQQLIATGDGADSIHKASWPLPDGTLVDVAAEAAGDAVVDIATTVRRYKTENQLFMGAELERLQVATRDATLGQELREAGADIKSVTRAKRVELSECLDVDNDDNDWEIIESTGAIAVALARQ
ncbi:MAG: valine--tRNA ligase [Chloroflexota bacterium]|nr:valine--tRNA ligase [Chloroflexota bacterium]